MLLFRDVITAIIYPLLTKCAAVDWVLACEVDVERRAGGGLKCVYRRGDYYLVYLFAKSIIIIYVSLTVRITQQKINVVLIETTTTGVEWNGAAAGAKIGDIRNSPSSSRTNVLNRSVIVASAIHLPNLKSFYL